MEIRTVLITIVAIGICIILYWLYQKNKIRMLEMEVNHLTMQRKVITEHYSALEEHISLTHQFRYDIEKHMQLMENLFLLEEVNKDDMFLEYQEDLYKQHLELEEKSYCKNKVLDALFYQKEKICNLKNIKFEINAAELDVKFIEKIDFFSLLYNLLDNAIEACERLNNPEEKYILFCADMMENKIQISVKNSFKEVNFSNGRLSTQKKEAQYHGTGITIIEDIVKKYAGSIERKWEGNHFTTNLTLQLF